MSRIKLEKGLKIYYATFKRKYDNKFSTALEDSGMDDDDLKLEFTSDANDFTLSDFDANFPLCEAIDDESVRSLEIFRICNNCYKYGEPPKIKCPPRSPEEKIPWFNWFQDMNYIRMRLRFLSDNVLRSAPVDFDNPETFKLRITAETFHVSVYQEYELTFNFRRAINPKTVHYKKSILGKMIDFVFEKQKKNKYWEHLLIAYHKQQFKQYCKIDWDKFLDKDDAIKKEKGILDEDDAFEQYRAPQTSEDENETDDDMDDDDDEKKDMSLKAIEPPKESVKKAAANKKVNENNKEKNETTDDIKKDNKEMNDNEKRVSGIDDVSKNLKKEVDK